MSEAEIGAEFSAMNQNEEAAVRGGDTFAGDVTLMVMRGVYVIGALQAMGQSLSSGLLIVPTQLFGWPRS